jgi:hypothetical protein
MIMHAGHNGCRDCLAGLQGRASLCPLCRAPFDPRIPLAPNTELRDLISLATFILMDERVSSESLPRSEQVSTPARQRGLEGSASISVHLHPPPGG